MCFRSREKGAKVGIVLLDFVGSNLGCPALGREGVFPPNSLATGKEDMWLKCWRSAHGSSANVAEGVELVANRMGFEGHKWHSRVRPARIQWSKSRSLVQCTLGILSRAMSRKLGKVI